MHEAGDIMIKDNQKVLNRVHVVMDALITTISYALAYVIKFYIIDAKTLGVGVLPPKDYFLVLLFLVPAYVLLYYLCNVYGPKRTGKQHREIGAIIKANTVGMALYIVILYLFVQEINYSRGMMAIFYVLNIVITTISRIILRKT